MRIILPFISFNCVLKYFVEIWKIFVLNNEQYIEFIEYILSYTGYGPLYNDKLPFTEDPKILESSHTQQIIYWANKVFIIITFIIFIISLFFIYFLFIYFLLFILGFIKNSTCATTES